jgi:hypothetical protein
MTANAGFLTVSRIVVTRPTTQLRNEIFVSKIGYISDENECTYLIIINFECNYYTSLISLSGNCLQFLRKRGYVTCLCLEPRVVLKELRKCQCDLSKPNTIHCPNDAK